MNFLMWVVDSTVRTYQNAMTGDPVFIVIAAALTLAYFAFFRAILNLFK